MCGIAGKVYFEQSHEVTPREMRLMARTMVHRGPDGEGLWVDGNVGLAHRRLAILDLREEANQPMCNEDGSIWVTFNGEIYNFQELRLELERSGHVFRTTSDTEVIVHAYEEYGKACVERFRGMFAFAIWDKRVRKLILIRDRVGKKPLYYYCGPDSFVFGSEIKALLADSQVPRVPNSNAINHFLALQYIPSPLSAFQGIQKLPAGHWLELKDGQMTTGRYWKLKYRPKRLLSIEEANEEMQSLFRDAVRLRMISDVPLGAFLSGGIDSSAVVMAMSQLSPLPIQTYCAGFDDTEFDERKYAKMVAERFDTTHTELLVNAPVESILPRLIWHYDEPFGDSSSIPSYAIAEVTRKFVTVVLNGDGGDENFAGYDRYITDRLIRRGDVIPRNILIKINQVLMKAKIGWIRNRPVSKIAKIFHLLSQDPKRRYARWGAHFQREEREELYTEEFLRGAGNSDPEGLVEQMFHQTDATDFTDAALDNDVNLYLADDLLVKMDRATMAHSLETRSPFLDHIFMEFVATLPPHMKLHGNQKKFLLKKFVRGKVPDIILDRPKMGFCVPLARWFRNDLREMTHDLLLSQKAIQRGYFHRGILERYLKEHGEGHWDHSAKLWDLLVLELWNQTFIDSGSEFGSEFSLEVEKEAMS